MAYIAIGSFFATVEEFLTVVVIRHDLASYVFTLLILFPAYLTFAWWSSRLIDRFLPKEAAREQIHFFACGFIGLLIEWFLIGLAPWSNPDANPLLMFVFQLGMYSFWATVAFAPRLFANPRPIAERTSRKALRFFVPYFLLVYLIAFAVPERMKFASIIPLVLFGYLFLAGIFLQYFWQCRRLSR